MQIEILNTNTPYTIDTYNTFDYDIESILISDYNDMHNTDYDYDNFDFDYNHKNIVKQLSELSIDYLKDNLDSDIITNIDYVASRSPREYNFATDSYIMNVSYNKDNLDKFIKTNIESYQKHCKDITRSYDGYIPFREYDDCLTDDRTMLEFYLAYTYNNDDYMNHMYDCLFEIYNDNTNYKLKD